MSNYIDRYLCGVVIEGGTAVVATRAVIENEVGQKLLSAQQKAFIVRKVLLMFNVNTL